MKAESKKISARQQTVATQRQSGKAGDKQKSNGPTEHRTANKPAR